MVGILEFRNVEIVATALGSGEPIKKVECQYDGYKESIKTAIKSDPHADKSLTEINETGKFNGQFTSLWHDMNAGKYDTFYAMYELAKLRAKYNALEADGFVGATSMTGKVNSTCKRCGKPIGFHIGAECKIANEMPDAIPDEFWLSLRPPPRAILAQLVDKLGGSTGDILRRADFSAVARVRKFVAETRGRLGKAGMPEEFRAEFEGFLESFGAWAKKSKRKARHEYVIALADLAQYAVIHELPINTEGGGEDE